MTEAASDKTTTTTPAADTGNAAVKMPTGEDPLQTHVVDVTGLEKENHLCNGLRTNDLVLVHDNKPCRVIVEQNQRMRSLCLMDNEHAHINVLDSAVVCTRSLRIINCDQGDMFIEDADIRRIEIWSSTKVRVILVGDVAMLENVHIICHSGCTEIAVAYAELGRDPETFMPHCDIVHEVVLPSLAPDDNDHIVMARITQPPAIDFRVFAAGDPLLLERMTWLQRFAPALEFATPEANKALCDPNVCGITEAVVREAFKAVKEAPYTVSDKDVEAQYDAERMEYEEEDATLLPKVHQVAELIKRAEHCVVFTGAGISTAAEIPDFRGPNGVWTKEDKGETPELGVAINETRPTYAHYALTELARRGMVKFICTTNMDGLHWRTGLPAHMLEELHGSAYTEHCPRCDAHYRRAEEVERGSPDHTTGNKCPWCGSELLDTIVNFSDTYRSPLEPMLVNYHSHKADLAIVMGTSCFVQPAASYPEKVVSALSPAPSSDAKKDDDKKKGVDHTLVMVNLQATPLDSVSGIRIFAKTDRFARALMKELNIEHFDMTYDAKAEMIKQQKQGKKQGTPEQRCLVQ